MSQQSATVLHSNSHRSFCSIPRENFPVQLYSVNILFPENRAVPQRSALILMVTGELGASLSHTLSGNLSEITLREVLRERQMCSVNSSHLKAKQIVGKPCSEEVKSSNNGPSSRKENIDTDILKFNLAATLWFGFLYSFI